LVDRHECIGKLSKLMNVLTSARLRSRRGT
jgi:hypothetical protein